MKKHILKIVAKISFALLVLALFLAVQTRASVAASAASAHPVNRYAPSLSCGFFDTEIYLIGKANIEGTCIGSQPAAVYGDAIDYTSNPSNCNTFASTTATLWGYYSGSYHVLAKNTNNYAGCQSVSVGGVRAQCGVIYHVQAEVNRWWWAGPPWYVSVNTHSFSFC